jgi:hypothetical protein
VVVSLNVISQTLLREVKLFDEARRLPHGTGTSYGQAPPVAMVVNPSEVPTRFAFSPRCMANYLDNFYHFKISYFMSNMIAPNDMFINTFIIWNHMETNIKGVHEGYKIPKNLSLHMQKI